MEDFSRVLEGCRVELSPGVLSAVRRAREAYTEFTRSRRVYGLYTGVGALQEKRLPGQGHEREERLVFEHAAGVGEFLGHEPSRLVLFTRVLQLSRGHSPIRPSIVEFLVELLNRDIIPAIPVYGSVGASGDLAPLAHIALAAMGRGLVWYRGELREARTVLSEQGLEPLRLGPGEALSLINGTAYSTGILAYTLLQLYNMLGAWCRVAGASIGLVSCNREHYDYETASAKRHVLPRDLYDVFFSTLRSVKPRSGEECGKKVQDPYSLRCTPQVISAVYSWLRRVEEDILREACSPADNPIVINGRVVHQCSFHGVHVALAADTAMLLIALLANVSERRIVQILDAAPPGYEFLGDPSSPSGLMIAQYTAASLTAMLRHMSGPHSVHSIPTSMLQEDYVSMSANAALRTMRALGQLEELIAIELLLAARLAYLRGETILGDMWPELETIVSDIRRPLSEMIAETRKLLPKLYASK